MDEGHGRSLKESVTQDSTAGQVLFVDETEEDVNHDDTERYTHQYNQTNKPNWVHDEYFGRTIQCGEITEHSHQKDFLALPDVDYGAKGKWAMSVWYRHVPGENFQGYQREQFFGHGDPVFPTSARNQVHIQFEKDDGILAIIKDSKDHDRYTIPCMKEWCPSEAYVKEHPNCAWEFPNEERNEAARACRSAYPDSASFETNKLAFTDNHNWHHLVLTTKGHGKGMDMYIDGKLEAKSPRGVNCENEVGGCIGLDKGNSDPSRYVNANGVGGDPIDPVGDMRLCGRQIGGAITNDLTHTGDVDFAQFDPRRYFHGQVAHFAVWDSPLSHHQVNALLEEYRELYNMKYRNPVVLTMTASGSPDDYADTSSLQEKFAAAAGVDKDEVTIIVQAGSVVITAKIAVRATASSEAVRASLAYTLGTVASASAALGITIESAPSIEIAAPPAAPPSLPPPPPPSPSPPSPPLPPPPPPSTPSPSPSPPPP